MFIRVRIYYFGFIITHLVHYFCNTPLISCSSARTHRSLGWYIHRPLTNSNMAAVRTCAVAKSLTVVWFNVLTPKPAIRHDANVKNLSHSDAIVKKVTNWRNTPCRLQKYIHSYPPYQEVVLSLY